MIGRALGRQFTPRLGRMRLRMLLSEAAVLGFVAAIAILLFVGSGGLAKLI